MNLQNLSGLIFHRLTVIGLSHRVFKKPKKLGSRVYWKCRCECGTVCSVEADKLRSGHSRSCGCLQKERAKIAQTTHGMSKTKTTSHPAYNSWRGMRERCLNPNHHAFQYYGGRGVVFDPKWKSFKEFWNDMGHNWSRGLTLERKDTNGNYTKDNCIWATRMEQASNKRNNHWIELDGIRLTILQWGKKVGLNHMTIYRRLESGWSINEALTTKAHGKR